MASLKEILTTNTAPNNKEEDNLKQFVSDCDDKLKIIDTKISELEAQLRILNDEKAAILTSVAPFRRALSPFRQLPEDIVREIFIACLETRRNPTMANTEAPVLLTQISSATRRIAISTQALWAAIHISISAYVQVEFMETAKSVMDTRAKGIEEWLLRRSGNLPLHISVYQSNCPGEGSNSLAADIMGVLRACCSRWKSLFLSCPGTSMSRISSVTQSDAPLLRSLAFYSDRRDIGFSSFLETSKIVAIPALRRFSQLGLGVASILEYRVNWANLTHLRCTVECPVDSANNGPYVSFVGILRQATRLISLRMNLYYPQGFSVQIDDISLPHLTSLAVNDYRTMSVYNYHLPIGVSLLESIDAPALEAISYNATQGENVVSGNSDARMSNVTSDALITLLKRSPNVQEFTMGTPVVPETIEHYLRHCPSLHSLYIRGTGRFKASSTDAQHALLQSFVLDDPTRCLCPNLEYIRWEAILAVSLNTLLNLIRLKNGTNWYLGKWKAVVLNVHYDPNDKALIDELKLEELDSDIKLKISYTQRNDFIRNLNEGLPKAGDPVNDWWPSIIDHTTNFF